MNLSSLPATFAWGTATAAFQIEGATTADGRGVSIWDTFCRQPNAIRDGSNADVACDSYHRWRDDIALIKQIGANAYRFSVAWPRVLPEGRGRVEPRGLDYYDALVDGLLEAGIEPWVTLYHWDLPQPLQDLGGWPNRDTASAFAEYADVVSRRLGDRVKRWITLNEPYVCSVLGHYTGEHAPGIKNIGAALLTSHHLLVGHGLAVPVLRANAPGAKVGITLDLAQVYPASQNEADLAAAQRWDGHHNRWFLDPLFGRGYPADIVALYGPAAPAADSADLARIGAAIDFLGVNYYSPYFVTQGGPEDDLGVKRLHPDGQYTAFDTLVYPDGLRDLLVETARRYPVKSLVVTENGASYDDPPPTAGRIDDQPRVAYLEGHIDAVAQAAAKGAPMDGYFVWSLMDNFEWAYGYGQHFGIAAVESATQRRVMKASGAWYRDTIAAHHRTHQK